MPKMETRIVSEKHSRLLLLPTKSRSERMFRLTLHILAAAEIIAEMGLDIDSAISAILHDTLEDTDTT